MRLIICAHISSMSRLGGFIVLPLRVVCDTGDMLGGVGTLSGMILQKLSGKESSGSASLS